MLFIAAVVVAIATVIAITAISYSMCFLFLACVSFLFWLAEMEVVAVVGVVVASCC